MNPEPLSEQAASRSYLSSADPVVGAPIPFARFQSPQQQQQLVGGAKTRGN